MRAYCIKRLDKSNKDIDVPYDIHKGDVLGIVGGVVIYPDNTVACYLNEDHFYDYFTIGD